MMELGVDPGLKSPYSSPGPEDCPVAEREFSWEQLENSIPNPFSQPSPACSSRNPIWNSASFGGEAWDARMKTKHWTRNQESWPGVLALPWIYSVTQRGALNFSDYEVPFFIGWR